MHMGAGMRRPLADLSVLEDNGPVGPLELAQIMRVISPEPKNRLYHLQKRREHAWRMFWLLICALVLLRRGRAIIGL